MPELPLLWQATPQGDPTRQKSPWTYKSDPPEEWSKRMLKWFKFWSWRRERGVRRGPENNMYDTGISEPQENTAELNSSQNCYPWRNLSRAKQNHSLKNNHSLQKLILAATTPLPTINPMKTLPCFRQLNPGLFPTVISIQTLNM